MAAERGVAICAMPAALTAADHLSEANAICRQLKVVWFTTAVRFNPRLCANEPLYKIYRRGMGCVATRSSPAALVAYLRKQRPPG